MIAPTHITFSEFLYLLILTTTGITLSPLNAITIGIASLLADIDTEASTIGRLVPFVSRRIEKRFGHRTLTHSLLFIILLATILSPLLVLNQNLNLYLCFILGYASHPFLDTMTINGVKLFWPFSNVKCVFPLEVNQPHRYRVQTGSKVDKTLAVLFFIGCIPTFLIAHQGYERFVRFTQRSIESAVRDYNEFSRTHTVRADILAHDLLTKEQLTGNFEIVGATNDHTLLFKGNDNRLHTLGKEYHAEYVAENVLCNRDIPVSTSVRSLEMANRTLGQLAGSSSEKTLFFGTLITKEKVNLPPESMEFSPISGSANRIVCNYARIGDFVRFGVENTLIAQGTLIARTLVPVKSADSTGIYIPSPYSDVSFAITPDQHVRFSAKVGDTVAVGRTLATITPSAALEAQIELARNQTKALENELLQKISELHTRIARKAGEVRRDSILAQRQNELRRRGFSKQGGSIYAYQRSRNELTTLKNSESTLKQKYSLKIQKLKTDILRLRAKQKIGQSIIRSNVHGIITEIRQATEATKRHTTFIIRSMQ